MLAEAPDGRLFFFFGMKFSCILRKDNRKTPFHQHVVDWCGVQRPSADVFTSKEKGLGTGTHDFSARLAIIFVIFKMTIVPY